MVLWVSEIDLNRLLALRGNHLPKALLLCHCYVILCSTMWGQCWAKGSHSEFNSSQYTLTSIQPTPTHRLLVPTCPHFGICVCVCVTHTHLWPSTPSSHPSPLCPHIPPSISVLVISLKKNSLWPIKNRLCLSDGLMDLMLYILYRFSILTHTLINI